MNEGLWELKWTCNRLRVLKALILIGNSVNRDSPVQFGQGCVNVMCLSYTSSIKIIYTIF